jgi:hypothetical protein
LIEAKAGVMQCRVGILSDPSAAQNFALSHQCLLLWPHVHPSFGISPKKRSILRAERVESLTRVAKRWRHAAAVARRLSVD